MNPLCGSVLGGYQCEKDPGHRGRHQCHGFGLLIWWKDRTPKEKAS